MRRSAIIALLVLLSIAAGGIQGQLPSARAQDATPPAEEPAGTSDAATFRSLAAGTIEVLAPSTANLVLGRITLAPGASIPFNPDDPSAILFYASSGELTFRVDVPMTVARASGGGTPVPPEEVAADTEFTLRDGDSALFPGTMVGEVRNNGDVEATAWIVDVVHVIDGAATPTP